MKQAISIILFFFLLDGLAAQDIHFSQFQAAPFHYNPAYTGQFNADYRLSAIPERRRYTARIRVRIHSAGEGLLRFGRSPRQLPAPEYPEPKVQVPRAAEGSTAG